MGIDQRGIDRGRCTIDGCYCDEYEKSQDSWKCGYCDDPPAKHVPKPVAPGPILNTGEDSTEVDRHATCQSETDDDIAQEATPSLEPTELRPTEDPDSTEVDKHATCQSETDDDIAQEATPSLEPTELRPTEDPDSTEVDKHATGQSETDDDIAQEATPSLEPAEPRPTEDPDSTEVDRHATCHSETDGDIAQEATPSLEPTELRPTEDPDSTEADKHASCQSETDGDIAQEATPSLEPTELRPTEDPDVEVGTGGSCNRAREYGDPGEDMEASSLDELEEEEGVLSLLGDWKPKFNEWKGEPLTIAVTGASGAGKSSFINAIRGLEPGDEGAAEEGITQTTMKPTRYCYPGNSMMQFWDLPGVGTPEFPRESYMDEIEFEKYDFHIVVSCGRFTEDDLWFARTIQKKRPNVPVYFVRTKLDFDIANARRRKNTTGTPHSSTSIVDKIRRDCVSYMDKHSIGKAKVFVVSNVLTEKVGDMDLLKESLVTDAVGLKKEALLLTLTSYSRQLIALKEELLKGKTSEIAMSSGAAACVPVPGVSEAADVALFLSMAHFYKNAFGLDDKSLASIAKIHSVQGESLKERLELESDTLATARGISTFLMKYAVAKTSGAVVKYFLPGAGSLIAGTVSYFTAMTALQSMVEVFANDAYKVYDFTHRSDREEDSKQLTFGANAR